MSTRLDAICSLIPPCRLLLDVGCDHGYVSAFAAKSGRCGRVIASDVSARSLRKAQRLLAPFPNAETRLGNGLGVLKAGEDPDVVVLSGMGGGLIIDILNGYEGRASLILGAQRDVYRLRGWLEKAGYRITDDFVVEERRKFYDVIAAGRGAMRLDERQRRFGAFWKNPSDALTRKCLFDLKRLSGTPNDTTEITEVIQWQQQSARLSK